jgi:DNA-binding response OmpR family regulator
MTHKILIVDDEPHIRLLISQTLEELEDAGCELLTADNGQSALAIIREEKPNLVFLDVMMPRLDGFEVCNTVKHELGLTDVFVVMLTAKGQDFDRLRGEQVGANEYMTKPFDPDELLRRAQAVLGLAAG